MQPDKSYIVTYVAIQIINNYLCSLDKSYIVNYAANSHHK